MNQRLQLLQLLFSGSLHRYRLWGFAKNRLHFNCFLKTERLSGVPCSEPIIFNKFTVDKSMASFSFYIARLFQKITIWSQGIFSIQHTRNQKIYSDKKNNTLVSFYNASVYKKPVQSITQSRIRLTCYFLNQALFYLWLRLHQ